MSSADVYCKQLGIEQAIYPQIYSKVSQVANEDHLVELLHQDREVAEFVMGQILSQKGLEGADLSKRLFYALGPANVPNLGFHKLHRLEEVLRERGLLNLEDVLEHESDMTIKCGDKEIQAHSSVLAAQSKFFHGALTGGFLEAQSGVCDLTHCGFDAQVVGLLVELAYASREERQSALSELDGFGTIEVARAAQYLDLSSVMGENWTKSILRALIKEAPNSEVLQGIKVCAEELDQPVIELFARLFLETASSSHNKVLSIALPFVMEHLFHSKEGRLEVDWKSMNPSLAKFMSGLIMGRPSMWDRFSRLSNTPPNPNEAIPSIENLVLGAHKAAYQGALGVRRQAFSDYEGKRSPSDVHQALRTLVGELGLLSQQIPSEKGFQAALNSRIHPREVLEYYHYNPVLVKQVLRLVLAGSSGDQKSLLNEPTDSLCLSALQYACVQGPQNSLFNMCLDFELIALLVQAGGDFMLPVQEEVFLPLPNLKAHPNSLELLLKSLDDDQAHGEEFKELIQRDLRPRMSQKEKRQWDAIFTQKTGEVFS